MAPSPLPTDRAAWRLAVADIATRAKAKLPECHGRIDAAVKLVLVGDVELLPDGGARVASRSDATVQYHAVNGHCDCRDYPRAPGNLCAHRLAYGIARRATELVSQSPPVETGPRMLPPAPATALPEAPASCNVYVTISGHKVQVTLRDQDEQRMLARLATLLQQYPAPEPTARPEGWCAVHAVQMQQTTKEGRSWWSHRHEGHWCKGK